MRRPSPVLACALLALLTELLSRGVVQTLIVVGSPLFGVLLVLAVAGRAAGYLADRRRGI